MQTKNKYVALIAGTVCLFLGITGLAKGFNSEQQWRQSFAIIGFIIMFAIFIFSLYIYLKNSLLNKKNTTTLMDNKFNKFYREKKWFIVSSLLFSFLISAIVKKVKPEENVLNFFIFYIVSPIVFYFVFIWIEKHYKKRKEIIRET